MFGLFNKNKKYKISLINQLLMTVLKKLPSEYQIYFEQVEKGIVKGVFPGSTYQKNYISISYDTTISKKYENNQKPGFTITNIKIFDKQSKSIVKIEIDFVWGLICGLNSNIDIYKCSLDFDSINIDNIVIKKDKLEEGTKQYLAKLGIKKFNPSDIYEVESYNGIMLHLRDLEDGDFLAVDDKGFFVVSIGDRMEYKIPSKYDSSLKNDFLSLSSEEIYSYII